MKTGNMAYGKGASWRTILSESITAPEDLPESIEVDRDHLKEVTARYPMRINPYYLGLSLIHI